jgi:hypothetical protein
MNVHRSITRQSALGIFSSVLLIIATSGLRSGAQAAQTVPKSASSHALLSLIPMLGPDEATVTILVFTDFDWRVAHP